jgi:hypothetical protein
LTSTPTLPAKSFKKRLFLRDPKSERYYLPRLPRILNPFPHGAQEAGQFLPTSRTILAGSGGGGQGCEMAIETGGVK